MRRASRWAQHAVIDVVAALFPGACRNCGKQLPLAASESQAAETSGARRIAALWDGRLERRLPGGLTLPSWFACPTCARTLQPGADRTALADGTDSVTAFAPSPLLFALVHAYKYEAQLQLGAWFGRRLAVAARARFGVDWVLLPVPSHPQRVRERGFDASSALALATAMHAGVALATGVVVRRRPTPPQARLAHAARAANVAGAFARSGRIPRRGRIVVLDDVITTGATVGAVISALAQPPERVAVLALCRARDLGVQDATRL